MRLALLAGLVSALWLSAFAWLAVDGLWRPDAFDYAQIARELAQGHGMSSRHAIYALHLEFLKQHDLLGADWPNLHRFPLPSLLMAAGFRLFGPSDAVVVGYGILFHALTAALVFAWARATLGVAAGVACVFLLGTSGALLELAPSGLAEPPVVFFFTLALYAVWRGREGAVWPAAAVAGAALGLAGLARTNALFAAPWLALALLAANGAPRDVPGEASSGGRHSLRDAAASLGVFAGAILLVSLPWWWRNALVAGDPFFSLHTYFLLPSGTDAGFDKWDLSVPWVRELTPPLEVLRERPGAVFAKWQDNLGSWLLELPWLAGLHGVAPLACVAAFVRTGEGLRATAWLVLACTLWNALLVSFTDFFLPKYHLHVVPALCLLAVSVVWWAAARLPRPGLRAAVCGAAVLAMADLGGAREAFDLIAARSARFDRADWQEIRRLVPEDAIVVSDQSHAVVWETGRRSVRLHYDRTPQGEHVLGVAEIAERYLPIGAVHLSRQFLRDPGKQAALRRTLADPGFRRAFPRLHALEGGGLLLLPADRAGVPTPRTPGPAGAPASPDRPAGPGPT